MQLLPPTDNLYKFLAIGGLAAIIASYYLLATYTFESSTKQLKLEQEFQSLLDEFHIKFGSRVAHVELWPDHDPDAPVPLEQSLAFSVATVKGSERTETRKHINLHYEQLGELMNNPNRSAKSREFWKKWYGMSDEQMDKSLSVADPKIDEITTSAKEFRPRFVRSLPLVEEMWMNQDALEIVQNACGWSLFVGMAAMCFGFVFWYVKVQRFQDEILRLDLVAKQTKIQ